MYHLIFFSFNEPMDTKEIRKANLIYLIGDVNLRGAASTFAKEYNLAPDQVRHVLTGFRPMGEKLARKFEIAIGLPPGSMDKPMQNTVMEQAANYSAKNQGEEAVKLLELFRKVQPEKRKTALKLIEALLFQDDQEDHK